MKNLMDRVADARPARLDPSAGAGAGLTEIMSQPRAGLMPSHLPSHLPGRVPRGLSRRLPRRLVLAGVVPAVALVAAVAVIATSAAPAPTAQDPLLVAAERAGSEPAATWYVSDSISGRRDGPEIGSRRLGPLSPGRQFPLGRSAPLPGITVTTAELSAAPTDPVLLRAWLTGKIRHAGTEPTGEVLFRAGESLVMDLPVTPQLRGAAYHMLAGLDGVHSLGPVTDRRGRAGTAVAYDYTGPQDENDPASPTGPMQARLIIDLPTGRALGTESYSLRNGVPALQRYTVVLMSYYTDRPPTTDDPIGAAPR